MPRSVTGYNKPANSGVNNAPLLKTDSIGSFQSQDAPEHQILIGAGDHVTAISSSTAGQLLVSNGSGADPSFQSTTTVPISNLAGGDTGYVPYQSSTNHTSFVAAGANNQVFQGAGTGNPPVWSDTAGVKKVSISNTSTPYSNAVTVDHTGSGAAVSVQMGSSQETGLLLKQTESLQKNRIRFDQNSGSKISTIGQDAVTGYLNISSDGEIILVSSIGSFRLLGLSVPTGGGYLKIDTAGGLSASAGSSATVGTSDNIAGGAANQLVIQTDTDSTGFLPLGTDDQALLGKTGDQPFFKNLSDINVGSARNISGGDALDIPYLVSSSDTEFIHKPTFTSGQIALGVTKLLTKKGDVDHYEWTQNVHLGDITTGAISAADITGLNATLSSLTLVPPLAPTTFVNAPFLKTGLLAGLEPGGLAGDPLPLSAGGTGNPYGYVNFAYNLKNDDAGGGSIPYQFGINQTYMLSPGAAGQFLQCQGPGQSPLWSSILTTQKVTATSTTAAVPAITATATALATPAIRASAQDGTPAISVPSGGISVATGTITAPSVTGAAVEATTSMTTPEISAGAVVCPGLVTAANVTIEVNPLAPPGTTGIMTSAAIVTGAVGCGAIIGSKRNINFSDFSRNTCNGKRNCCRWNTWWAFQRFVASKNWWMGSYAY